MPLDGRERAEDRMRRAREILLRKRALRRKADAFLIWRTASQWSWDCTAEEVADITDLTVHRVKDICAERGWDLRESISDRDVLPVDEMMARREHDFVSVLVRGGHRVSVPRVSLRPRRSM